MLFNLALISLPSFLCLREYFYMYTTLLGLSLWLNIDFISPIVPSLVSCSLLSAICMRIGNNKRHTIKICLLMSQFLMTMTKIPSWHLYILRLLQAECSAVQCVEEVFFGFTCYIASLSVDYWTIKVIKLLSYIAQCRSLSPLHTTHI